MLQFDRGNAETSARAVPVCSSPLFGCSRHISPIRSPQLSPPTVEKHGNLHGARSSDALQRWEPRWYMASQPSTSLAAHRCCRFAHNVLAVIAQHFRCSALHRTVRLLFHCLTCTADELVLVHCVECSARQVFRADAATAIIASPATTVSCISKR